MYKSKLSKTLLLALGLGLSLGASAKGRLDVPAGQAGKNQSAGKGNKISAACLTSSSSASLDINNVRAMVLNGGDMWWNLFDARYEVPKVDDPNLPKRHSIFAGAVWLGGKDQQDNLYLAAQTYRQGPPFEQGYWPGPLNDQGKIEPEDCAAWNYHAKIDKTVIDKFRDDFARGAFGQDENLLPKPIKDWPAKRNPHIRTGVNMNMELAPFVNVGGDPDAYEPLLGDYPDFRGDQGIWWVMNDAGGVKEPLSKQIGLELQVLAFAFQTNDLINNMTFYKQILKNKGTNQLKDTYLGQWVDPDLGFFNDDFVGCDVARGLGICYNGDNDDQGANGYGLNPPAVGVDFFQGPTADENDGVDNDRDGIIDEPGEKIIMSSFIYYNNNRNTTNGNPNKASDYYNYLQAVWMDGKTITFGGDGTDQSPSAKPYKFMFPGDSDPLGYGYLQGGGLPTGRPGDWFNWTENNTTSAGNVSNTPADRRFLQSAGPFTLNPGAVNELTIGVVWARANSGGALGSLGLLKFADDRAQKLFDNDFLLPQGPDAPELAITELDQQLVLTLLPRTFRTSAGDVVTTETYCEQDRSLLSNPAVKDPSYCFEGYKIYQLKDLTVTAAELYNTDRARLVAQADIKNGVTNIINYTFDADLNMLVPTLRVQGADEGVFHTLNVTTDLFATGDDRIINFKQYHYLVVAYAYNGDPANIEDKYLEGRRVSVGTGIPHKTEAELGGTVLNSKYGSGASITRIFGTGNGGNILEISSEDEQQIVATGNKALLNYQPGNAPFVVKVYDPKKVRGGEFNVKLSSRLEYRLSSANGTPLNVNDTIVSTGDFTKSLTVTTLNPNKISGPQIPGRAIVRRIVSNTPVLDSVGNQVDQRVLLDIEMLNDHIYGTFTANVELYKTENPGGGTAERTTFEGYIFEDRPFRSTNSNFTAVASNFVLHDFWNLTFLNNGRQVRGDRPISEFNEQIVIDPQDNEPYGIAIEFKHGNNPGYRVNVNLLNGFQTSSMSFSGRKSWYEGIRNGDAAPGTTTQPWLLRRPTNTAANEELTNIDPNLVYLDVMNGTWAPYGVTANAPSGPAYVATNNVNRKLYDLRNVDVVITSDKSKWTRVPVLAYSGGAPHQNLTKFNNNAPSVNKDGQPDGSVSPYNGQPSTNMGWFPGYAVDLDRGIRLNMMFSESVNPADPNDERGKNLIWDPSSAIDGGKHFIYVMNSEYNEARDLDFHLDLAKATLTNPGQTRTYIQNNIFNNVLWVGYPRLAQGFSLLESDVRFKMRVNRYFMSYNPAGEYNVTANNQPTSYKGNFNPEYSFNTDALVPQFGQNNVAKSALDLIRVVPNPYYAYSQYEQRQLDNIVKITNLPRRCKIQIFTINGVLVKTFNKDDTRTFLDWNLKNESNLTIASGAYIINVDAGNAGSKVLKFFGIMRPIDLESF